MLTIIKKLAKKYQYIKNNKGTFSYTLGYWLGKYAKIDPWIELLNYIQQQYNDGDINLDNIFSKMDMEKKITFHKYNIYHKHKLEDFHIFKFASDFYGESLDILCEDIKMLFCIKKISSKIIIPEKLLNSPLGKDIEHLLVCRNLQIISFVFYHFKISVILENDEKEFHLMVKHSIIKTIKKKLPCDAEHIYRFAILDKWGVNNLLEKMKIIYDIYAPAITAITSMCNEEFIWYISKNLDFLVYFHEFGHNPKKIFYSDKYFLVMAYVPLNNTKKYYKITPKILNINTGCLTIEI